MDIQLIDLNKDSLELVRQWRNSPEVSKFMYTSNTITENDQIKWFERVSNDNSQKFWLISFNEKMLGLASLNKISKTFDSCYWAFYLGDTSVRGAGIGSKVEYNVIEYVFNELQLNKLRCEVLIVNPNVISMHEKFGFRREAYYRQHVLKDGEYIDTVGLALLKSDWIKIKPFMQNKIYGND